MDIFNSNKIQKRKEIIGHYFVKGPSEYIIGTQAFRYLICN